MNRFVILALCGLLFESFNAQVTNTTCTKCRCYKVKCSRLDDPDIDCQDDFKDSCDNSDDITEESDCNQVCDCCLEGQCFAWSSFKCIIYRTFEFSSVIYFILFSVHFFLLWRLSRHFFTVKKKWELGGGPKEKKNDEQKQFYRYEKLIWIKKHPDIFKKNVNNDKEKSVLALFNKIEDLKPLSIRNLVIFGIFVIYFTVMSGLNFYVLFTQAEKPLTYCYICWFQHAMLIIFWIFLFLSFNRFSSYAKQVVRVLEEFEVERNCKVRIVDKVRFLEINFDPQKFLRKEPNLAKQDGKDFIENEKEPINVGNDIAKKMKLGEDKPKIAINKVKPL